MTTDTITKTAIPSQLDPRILTRLLEEGYGPGAWHGADLRAALAEVTPRDAFRRPAAGRHNIAEIALHHAWSVRGVIAQLSPDAPEPFPVEGSDWFELSERGPLSWERVLAVVEEHQRRLASVVADLGAGASSTSVPPAEQFDLVLGVTCHAVYHAGQIQLVKVLNAAA